MTSSSPRPARTWSWPTQIRFGAGRIAELPEAMRSLGARRPLFITDTGLIDLDPTHRALSALQADRMDHAVFSEVHPNPTGKTVEAGVAAFRAGDHDGVIAFGGGSAIDAAKAVALMARQTRPIWDFEDVGDNWTRVNTVDRVPVVAVPTAAGTGSELGRSSVISATGHSRKVIIFHPIMLPGVAILDPELTAGLPPALTASTGMDALEAFVAPNFHPMADGMAAQALRMIKHALPRAFADGADLEARSDMLLASGMACVALQKGLGGVHAISHSLGAIYDLRHGVLNAILLPHVTAANLAAAGPQLAELARLLDLPSPGAEAVVAWLRDLQRDLRIPASLAQLGVGEDRLDEVIALSLTDPCAVANPAEMTPGFVREILRAATG
jgi:alcohol dehydrogenase class IV